MSTLDRDGERRRKTAEDLYQHGRSALRAGERDRARQLLEQAVDYDRGHSDAWLWLTATTDDPQEQKRYLEWAIAADPGNAAARRGLGLLIGKIKTEDVLPEGAELPPRRPEAPEPAVVRRTFTCPRCGGRLRFDTAVVDLRCENCGHVEAVAEEPAAGQEQVLDFSLPTRQGHRWAEAERRFTCQQCGAGSVLPPGQTSNVCPFCASAALVVAAEEDELLPPQGVIPMKLEAEAVFKRVRAWLGRGFFAPDDLGLLARGSRMAPVYVPCWSFNTTLTSRWKALVEEGSGQQQHRVWRDGEETLFYTQWLQPGTRALPADLLREVEPFDLKQLVVYKPEYLAGWPAGTYDISLAQASLDARAAMIKAATSKLWKKVLPGRVVTDLQITGTDFTGQTYQLVLLPIWIGNYHYRGRAFRVVVNGQTGRVAGDKPLDTLKVALLALLALAAVVVIAGIGVWVWLNR
jgi:DNA-directed RNA polymerase subunit RPC12/RpoP